MRKESGMGRMWVNPYKSLVPQVGYYDINCLLEALKLKKCHVGLHAVFNPKVRTRCSEPAGNAIAFRERYILPLK